MNKMFLSMWLERSGERVSQK